MPWKPHGGQRKAVKFLLEHACAAILADPGVGKTSIVLAALSFLMKKGMARKALIIAPLRVCYHVWPAEVEKWTDFGHLRVSVLHGPKKDAALAVDADVYVINPEGLDWLMGAEKSGKGVRLDVARFKRMGFDTLIVDELTKLKSPSTNRFKTLKLVLDTFARRWGLTGTPAPNGLLDLFGQMYVLDQGQALGRFITHYKNQYFTPSYDGFSWLLKPGAEERIYERIRPLALRLAASDYVDMPDQVDVIRTFDLSSATRKLYDRLEEDLILNLDEETVQAANAGVVSIKLRQVTQGAIYKDPELIKLTERFTPRRGKREWIHLHDEKLDLLSDLIEELQGEPVLVAYDFQHDLERVLERFPGTPYLGSGVPAKRSAEIVARWNAGEIPVLLGHPQSIGHGLNLQGACHHVCWFAQTYDLELYDQFNRRVRRQGNARQKVFVHHLVARDTVDQLQIWALRRKEKWQTALLDALKEMRSGRR